MFIGIPKTNLTYFIGFAHHLSTNAQCLKDLWRLKNRNEERQFINQGQEIETNLMPLPTHFQGPGRETVGMTCEDLIHVETYMISVRDPFAKREVVKQNVGEQTFVLLLSTILML